MKSGAQLVTFTFLRLGGQECPPPIWADTKKRPGGRFSKMQLEINPAYRPFFERRVPAVAPWRALNFGFDLQITYTVPLRFTTWQSA